MWVHVRQTMHKFTMPPTNLNAQPLIPSKTGTLNHFQIHSALKAVHLKHRSAFVINFHIFQSLWTFLTNKNKTQHSKKPHTALESGKKNQEEETNDKYFQWIVNRAAALYFLHLPRIFHFLHIQNVDFFYFRLLLFLVCFSSPSVVSLLIFLLLFFSQFL